ncbi:MAG: flotillin family protein [Cyclobacteriaceae bacterium]|nr:flotillin family protein [Cyclobacteriaceae bacterium]
MSYILIAVVAGILFLAIILSSLFKRYKRCPSDRILVVFGRVGSNADGVLTARCIHGGAAFIWPIIQDYKFMDLTPISIEVNLTNALSRQNIRVDVPSRFTVGISTESGIMNNAAERLLGLTQQEIYDLAKDIIFGQLRLVVATMDIEEINNNRDKFLANVASNVEAELKKIGLKLINVNVTDIKDESGYIEALGKEAASKAVNDARKSVAEKNRDGSIGEADAFQDERIKVAALTAQAKIGEAEAAQLERIKIAAADSLAKIGESESSAKANVGEAEARKNERIAVSEANARAVEGENMAKISIANSEALRREKEAEAQRKAIAAEKVSQAKALEEAYESERKAEVARALRDKASQMADIVIPSQIDKEKVEIDAEATAERIRRQAKGEADAIFFKMQAEANGMLEILSKQAEGFQKIVEAAGSNSRDAVLLMIADKLPEIVKSQVEAIKNIKIDKVTVWDSGSNGNGTNATSNFLSGLAKSLPPIEDLLKNAGIELPALLQGANHQKTADLPAEVHMIKPADTLAKENSKKGKEEK